MKKIIYIISLTFVLLLTSCSGKDTSTDQNKDTNETIKKSEEKDMKDDTTDDITTKEKVDEVANIENSDTDDTTKTDVLETEAVIEEIVKNPFIATDSIPEEYLVQRTDSSGTIEYISYSTLDYFGDSAAITKNAYVYLPYNYDESTSYNVLYLMHGIGGNEREWGMVDDSSKVKIMLDNLIYNGDIEPFIVVAPNGRSSVNFADSGSDHNSFYVFGQELRNDLIPFIDSTYSTYAEYDENGYDLAATRDHRAMAGLSMGGMQTINIGICESLDIISSFGAFSAAPTSYTAPDIATALKDFEEYDINYFYNICGTEDGIAFASASAAVTSLSTLTDKLIDDENFIWQTVSGGHGFDVWYLGFYNFAQVAFR